MGARHNKITAHLRNAGLGALTDLGFVGLDDDPDNPVIVTGRKATRGKPLTAAQKEANKLVNRERAANEHGFADLKNWRILTKVRMNPRHATTLLRALLVLTNARSPADRRSPPRDHARTSLSSSLPGEVHAVSTVLKFSP
jgi:hypothetical protein